MSQVSILPLTDSGELATLSRSTPTVFLTNQKSSDRFFDFFTSNIRNRNTRIAYYKAACRFSVWTTARGIDDLHLVRPIHIATYIEQLLGQVSKPTVKQQLAALRMLFDWLVVGQTLEHNPAHAVRGPKHSVKKGKTPVLTAEETRALLDAIDTGTLIGLRDRALIALMTYSFARIGAAIDMRGEDYYVQGRRGWLRLREKGGKEHQVPCHHRLDGYLEQYVVTAAIAPKDRLFRTIQNGKMMNNPLGNSDAWRMVNRRASAAGIRTKIGNHTFRATGITAYLKNGGRLEIAQQIAAHESSRTTGLYDRRSDDVSLDEIERIVL